MVNIQLVEWGTMDWATVTPSLEIPLEAVQETKSHTDGSAWRFPDCYTRLTDGWKPGQERLIYHTVAREKALVSVWKHGVSMQTSSKYKGVAFPLVNGLCLIQIRKSLNPCKRGLQRHVSTYGKEREPVMLLWWYKTHSTWLHMTTYLFCLS